MMVQTEGFSALMSGVSATVARGVFYGGAGHRARVGFAARSERKAWLCACGVLLLLL